jgi:hypothetical protein
MTELIFQCVVEDASDRPERYLPPTIRIFATFDPWTHEGNLGQKVEELEASERVTVTKVINEATGKEVVR